MCDCKMLNAELKFTNSSLGVLQMLQDEMHYAEDCIISATLVFVRKLIHTMIFSRQFITMEDRATGKQSLFSLGEGFWERGVMIVFFHRGGSVWECTDRGLNFFCT